MAPSQPEDTLDLSSLRSFSPDWSPSLRLAVCIATSYAGHRLCERIRALAQPTSTGSDRAEERGIDIDEDGKPLSPADADAKESATLSRSEEQRRRDLLASWQDFAQKFLSATCQHLGVVEETLPPSLVLLRDVLTASQGSLEIVEGTHEAMQRVEELLDREEQGGRETGSIFWREHNDRIIRSDAPDDFVLYRKQASNGEKPKQEEPSKDAGGPDQLSGSQDLHIEFDRQSMESDAKELDQEAEEILRNWQNDGAQPSPKSPQFPAQSEGTAPQGRRVGGALDDGDGAQGKEFEIFNELLLIALGLGQYRAKDGATTLFEQDALFDEPPKRQSASTDSDERQQGESVSSGIHPQPDPIDLGSAHTGQGLEKAIDQIKLGATSSWGWASERSKQGVSQLSKSMGISARGADRPETSAAKRKAKKPVKPNELCHYDARARALIFVAGAAMGLQSQSAHDSEKVMSQTIHFIMNAARSAAAKQGYGDPLGSVPAGADVDTENDRIVSRLGSAGEAPELQTRTTWMNKAGNEAVEGQKKLGWKKWMVAGGGFAVGGVILGVTGGLAAPLVVPALAGLTGLTFLATSGGIIMLGTLFGLTGGGLAGYRVHRRLRGLDSFEFAEVETPARLAGVAIPSLHATICISGLILEEQAQLDGWKELWQSTRDSRDVYAVRSEAAFFAEAGRNLRSYVLSSLTKQLGTRAAQEVAKRTALASLTAIMLPLTVAGALGTGLDSIFVRAKAKAVKQGLILAETLKAEVQGHRPVVLVGASLGAVTVLTCLKELARDPEANAHLVDSAYLICAPSTAGSASLRQARSVVARRFVNAFSRADMVCGIAAWLGLELSAEDVKAGKLPKVLGSGPIDGVAGLENIDVSSVVTSHFDLAAGPALSAVCHYVGVVAS
ncbi:unnamed protein product [Parajaminaea phylloscopi]